MKNTKKWLLNQITQVANSDTNFEKGFDVLFRFMAKNPESETTQRFIDYHILEKNNPKTPKGEADFTYLIGKRFDPDEWVADEDV